MSLDQDLAHILDIIENVDPSFSWVGQQTIDRCVHDVQAAISDADTEGFVLASMRLMALSGNGHTRLIPNDAIQVLPFRFVCIGSSVFLTETAPMGKDIGIKRLVAVNGTPVDRIAQTARAYLAGTRQRQRVIGALLYAWPAALARLGYAPKKHQTVYQFQSSGGGMTSVTADNTVTIPATDLYPRNEHGHSGAATGTGDFADIRDWPGTGCALVLRSFFDPDGQALPAAIARAANHVHSRPDDPLLIDLRGNTGGDFLKTLPLIEAIAEPGRRCAVLVDKFTFSAAIVFVAILKYRLGPDLTLIGEKMGDRLQFFAEGGLMNLPASGAILRYSTVWHDWETGQPDRTTTPDLARQFVAVGKLDIDHSWLPTPFDALSQDMIYHKCLQKLT